MTFSQSIKTCFVTKYATFSGRASRSEFWFFFLFNLVVSWLLSAIGGAASANAFYGLLLIYGLIALIPNLAVTVRRLHDTGRSGGWWFICLIPIIGSIWLLILMILDSQHAPNKYGSPEA